MSFGKIYDIASATMSANRMRINTVSSNIANAETTRTPEGGPYKRRDVVFAAVDMPGTEVAENESLKTVRVASVEQDNSTPRMVFDPSHPDADENGIVALPNINVVTEMVNLMTATNAYKAGAEIANATREMAQALRPLSQRF